MTALTTYQFPVTGQTVRSVLDPTGQPWFVARDAAEILRYSNPREAIRDHVPAAHRKGSDSLPLADLGLHPQTVLISEAGLYRLIMRSRTDAAEAFQEWVTAEVLPAIRKTGGYSAAPAIPQTYAQALQLAANQARQIEEQAAQLAIAAPKAESWDVLASGAGDYSVGDAAKILSRDPGIQMGRDRLFAHLAEAGWVYRSRADGRYRAYQTAVDSGRLSELPQTYPTGDGGTAIAPPQVRITPKGLHVLHQALGGQRPLQLPLPV